LKKGLSIGKINIFLFVIISIMVMNCWSGDNTSQEMIIPVLSSNNKTDLIIINESLNHKIIEHKTTKTNYNGHEYQLISYLRTWSGAKSDCESRGGYLVTITSQEENDFISSLIGEDDIWIGFTDEANEGDWQWVTGESVTYTNWIPGEPNDSGEGEDYAATSTSGGWNDLADLETHYYICEWGTSTPPPDFSFPILGLAFLAVIPELYFGRRINKALSRKSKEEVGRT